MRAGSADGDWRAGLQHDAGVVQDGLRALQSLLGDAAAITIAAAARTIAAAARTFTTSFSTFLAAACAIATTTVAFAPGRASFLPTTAHSTCAVCLHPGGLFPDMPAILLLRHSSR